MKSRGPIAFGAVIVAYTIVLTRLSVAATETKEKVTLPQGCLESICGSVVSKCLLTQSCKCGPNPAVNNITCARDCFYCLDYLYPECCSCVDVCRKDNVGSFSLNQKSNVEDLPEPVPALFQMLMESPETSQGRWTSLSFPAHHTVIGLNKDLHFVRISPHPVSPNGSIDGTPPPIDINPTYDSNAKSDDVNCTVAFMKTCLSLNKCREDCMSLGASSYRWFHDGCCECVGSTCLNYGLHEGRCQQCPISKDMLHNSVEADDEIVISNPHGAPGVVDAALEAHVVPAVEERTTQQATSEASEQSTPPPPPPPLMVSPVLVVSSIESNTQLHKADDNSLTDNSQM